MTYRADVLPFMLTDPTTLKPKVNGVHRIQVPDWGLVFGDDDEGGIENLNHPGPRAVGASLVLIYRDHRKPFKAIVIHDGGHTKRAAQTMTQTIAGYYDASSTAPNARMTHVVGDGRAFLFERVRVNGQLIATNPFVSADGAKWDNTAFPLGNSLPGLKGGASVTVKVEPYLIPDCLSWSAIVFSTDVNDADKDGLLDSWEEDSNLVDPKGQPLPDFAGMGATPGTPDVFVEVGAMEAAAGTTYGPRNAQGNCVAPACVADLIGHRHLPTPAVVKQLGDTLKNAPVPIRLHMDVGPEYHALGGAYSSTEADEVHHPARVCPRRRTDHGDGVCPEP